YEYNNGTTTTTKTFNDGSQLITKRDDKTGKIVSQKTVVDGKTTSESRGYSSSMDGGGPELTDNVLKAARERVAKQDTANYGIALQAKVDERRANGDTTSVVDIEKELIKEIRSGKTLEEVTRTATASTSAIRNAERNQAIDEYMRIHPESTVEQAGKIIDENLFYSDKSYNDQHNVFFRTNEDGSIQYTFKDEDGNIVRGEGSFFEEYVDSLTDEEKEYYNLSKNLLNNNDAKNYTGKNAIREKNPEIDKWNKILSGSNLKSAKEWQSNLENIDKAVSAGKLQTSYWQGLAKKAGVDAFEDIEQELKDLKNDCENALVLAAEKADELKTVSKELIDIDDQLNSLKDTMNSLLSELSSLPPRPKPDYEEWDDEKGHHIAGPTNYWEILQWDNNKKRLDKAIAENKKAQDDLNAQAKEKINRKNELVSFCKKYSNLIKLASVSQTKERTSPNGPPDDDDSDGEQKTEPKTEAPTVPNLEDTTESQLQIYEQLTTEQLELIANALQEFANTNNLTVDSLLLDEANSEKLVELLLAIDGIPKDLKILIEQGDRVATQSLLNSIFTGERNNIVGLNESAVDTLHTYLNDVAVSRGLTLEQLVNDSNNHEVLRASLQGYNDVSKEFKGLTSAAIRDEVIAVNDGNGIDSLSEGQVSIVRDYTSNLAKRENMTVEDYYGSNTIENDFTALSKSSILMNNLSHYSSGKLSETLTKLLTRNN
ncbi:MAG: hypothetical protein IJ568_00170, partial [Bacilli bacterium]|nr:hypothetical protein [Bacilli bacterium]